MHGLSHASVYDYFMCNLWGNLDNYVRNMWLFCVGNVSQNKIHSAKWGVQIAGMIFQTRSKARGCGIEKIKDSCEEAGNPMPEYTIKCEDIMVMFKSLVSSLVNHTNQATNQTIPNEDNSFESDWDRTYVISEKIADIIGEKYSTDFFLFQD